MVQLVLVLVRLMRVLLVLLAVQSEVLRMCQTMRTLKFERENSLHPSFQDAEYSILCIYLSCLNSAYKHLLNLCTVGSRFNNSRFNNKSRYNNISLKTKIYGLL